MTGQPEQADGMLPERIVPKGAGLHQMERKTACGQYQKKC